MDEFDEYLDDDFEETDEDVQDSSGLDDYSVESTGFMDGESDVNLRMPKFGSYGSSIDIESLTDRQRALYDNAYYSGQDAASGPDVSDDDFDL